MDTQEAAETPRRSKLIEIKRTLPSLTRPVSLLPSEWPSEVRASICFGRNRFHIVCRQCGCRILKPSSGRIARELLPTSFRSASPPKSSTRARRSPRPLNGHRPLPAASPAGSPAFEHCLVWTLESVFDFLNVGFQTITAATPFSHQGLLCACCNEGPIGVRELIGDNRCHLFVDKVLSAEK